MPMVNGKKYPYTEEGKKKAKKAAMTKKESKSMPPKKATPKITITGSTTSSRRYKPQPSPKLSQAINKSAVSMNPQKGPKGISDMTKSPLPIVRKTLEGSKKTGKGKAASTPKPMLIPKQFREMREPYVPPAMPKRKPKVLFPKKPGR